MSRSSDFCRQSRAISKVWWCTNLTMAIESADISDSVDKFWLLRMKLRRRSSICLVAFGNRSLYNEFIMTISLSITGERIGLLNDLERGLMDGDRRPSSSIKLGFESFD